jgi:hypothetical protein
MRMIAGALVTLAMTALAIGNAEAQSVADSTAIRQAALDYIEGWYEGNPDRMARALHPELVKRIVHHDAETGARSVRQMGASQLVAGTRAGGGREAENRRSEVKILDIYENVASVRVDAGDWVDYLQLVRWEGGWNILNVLWELRPKIGTGD